ncbi:carboxylating nicotinate-nucleotide diphosphorylase [Agrobacterium sp. SHOUNA12C]|uniref:Probable nicotinate-nucleotide pyrophosphorylase [carboxylating] n=1 Tax=Rhizobium rhizogenes NBRC 13257 TaxID=1220581 RepID=A0AA87Q4S2_RHIRH|nr:carboxylating nicotinate-nucleotide diphosphorylase [Rhizobium rhizogenes]MCJ9719589.1 carboxylating nicotinate-nucleotide diphosphorylase [Agrobacterium sp. BETTINA12B]MCJ9759336.1 carboxylating nicotinate-nucleotide diphosphorylase [Agrobacterium sp. SHOUNA12C]OCJ02091.1 nicotinate-nucleotide diphosphorylase (carboxylating) [Agrobacterium sp. 13-626]OCJ15541.1 nicotinate-nucleotide diphosphorylase (carboxylating) [Agrobacterium sp. B133/95]KEA09182.1 nicotinate-nucleotide pyrophosphorylas
MPLVSLPRLIVEPLVRNALLEDLGLAGDITSAAVIPEDHCSTVAMVARQPGVVAGLDASELAFQLVDPSIVMTRHVHDGAKVAAGDVIATIEGPSRGLLTAERTALNFLGHLSGIASVTAGIVEAINGTKASIVCTRKTTPGLRALEKYAVRAGGGMNHRFALHDAVLIKDNHVAIAGGVAEAIRRAKAGVGHMVKIEVEVDTLDQLRDAMEEGVDAVLLDNMTPDQLRDAVGIVAGRAITEASGRITPATAAAIAASGVDLISVGWLTHSAPTLDIGLDWQSVA